MTAPATDRAEAPGLIVGTDIVDVADVEASIASFGDRYLRRVFTDAELEYCLRDRRGGAPHLAARFAAKEATLKVLRPTKDDAIPLLSIEAVKMPGGHCELALHGPALAAARRAGLTEFSMSLSHETRYATAVVIARRAGAEDPSGPRPPRRSKPIARGANQRP